MGINGYIDLTGKVAVITGSARGIGMESAKMLAQAGATAVICDIDTAGVDKTVKDLEDQGLKAVGVPLDVSSEQSVKTAMANIAERLGGIDILVNNAGILDPTAIDEMTVDKWDRMLAINLRGVQLCSQYALPYMTDRPGGRIVNMSSQGGQLGGFLAGVHYTAAKGGIIALTKAYARYCAQFQINVNCVAPGFMLTDMTKDRNDNPDVVPLKRLGTALDAAKCVFFLSTGLSDYVTGATVDVNGGYYMR